MRHLNKTRIRMALACIWLLVPPLDAAAHNVTVFAWLDGNTVNVESKYSGGRRPKGAPIEVYDKAGNLLLKGETDDKGEFSFAVPRKTELRVVLLAGMGHRAEWIVPVEDLQGLDPTPAAAPGEEAEHAPAEAPSGKQSGQADLPAASSAPAGPAADIETAVEKALDRKLKPVLKMLAESRQTGPGLRDIVGGIGYIIGLVGLAAYLRSRQSGK